MKDSDMIGENVHNLDTKLLILAFIALKNPDLPYERIVDLVAAIEDMDNLARKTIEGSYSLIRLLDIFTNSPSFNTNDPASRLFREFCENLDDVMRGIDAKKTR